MPPRRIVIVTPAPAGSNSGNRVTADRWAGLLRGMGHAVRIETRWSGRDAAVLVALHARRSAESIARFRTARPEGRIVVAMTGTDLYRDIDVDESARRSLEIADRLVVINPVGIDALPDQARAKARVILQSALPAARAARRPADEFRVTVVGHLREEKDPFRAADAARLLEERSRVRVLHLGEALDPALGRRAERESRTHPRYRWIGGVSRTRAKEILASSEAMVLSSWIEGGANVISEAVVEGVPVLASRIASSVALLGGDYPAYFEPGDTEGLAALLARFERDAAFRNRCRTIIRRIAPKFSPARERSAWRTLLRELG